MLHQPNFNLKHLKKQIIQFATTDFNRMLLLVRGMRFVTSIYTTWPEGGDVNCPLFHVTWAEDIVVNKQSVQFYVNRFIVHAVLLV